MTLLADLETLGLRLAANGDKLRWAAPVGVVTQELRQQLADHKAELLAALRERLVSPQTVTEAGFTPTPAIIAEAEIVALVHAPQTLSEAEAALASWLSGRPPRPRRCGICGSASFWRREGEELCGTCHPDPQALSGPEGR